MRIALYPLPTGGFSFNSIEETASRIFEKLITNFELSTMNIIDKLEQMHELAMKLEDLANELYHSTDNFSDILDSVESLTKEIQDSIEECNEQN